MRLPPFVTSIERAWSTTLNLLFFALCLRFQIAGVREFYPEIWPTVALSGGSIILMLWLPFRSAFALTAAIPLLTGLGTTTILRSTDPLSLAFSALFIAASLRGLCLKTYTFQGRKTTDFYEALKAKTLPSQPDKSFRLVSIICDSLATAILLSFARQL